MKKVYLVFGGEACGNHLATNMLVWTGIKKGTTIKDIVDPKKIKEDEFPVVFRRSFPHGGIWYKAEHILDPMLNKELIKKEDVFVIVPVRSWDCAIKSSLMRGHSKTKAEAVDKLKRAYKNIFSDIINNGFDYMIFSYDEATRRPTEYLEYFYDSLSLKVSADKKKEIAAQITNENDKFYQVGYKPTRSTDGY